MTTSIDSKRNPGRFGFVAAILGVAAAAVWLAPVRATAEDLMHARVSYDSGGGLVKGTEDTEWSYSPVNTMILPGDTLWVDNEGILEVEMSGGTFLRMADDSKAEINQLPPNGVILGWTGAFYVQRISRSTGEFVFRTPAANITIDKDSQVRVDVIGEGSTTVSVRWGRATVRTESGAPAVAVSGQRIYVDPGLLPSNPVPFDKSAEDDFDAWNRERAQTLAVGTSTPIPASTTIASSTAVPIGYTDLANYGEWVYVDSTPYWRPTTIVEYVPYRDGYWSYVPSYGYSWVGSYPFCYVTSHYGRWTRHDRYGWLWCYDPVWAPSWVATCRYGPYFVWSPLDRYNRPCYWGGVSFSVGGVNFSFGASSFCYADDLLNWGPCGSYAVYRDQFHGIRDNDIYIWNIYAGGRNRYDRHHFGSNALVRDYIPRRVVRGLARDLNNAAIAAVDRARDLESRFGRAEFARADRGSTRAVRTPQTAAVRDARLRSVKVERDVAATPERIAQRSERVAESLRTQHSGPNARQLPERIRTARHSDAESPRELSPREGARVTRPGDGTDGERAITNRDAEQHGRTSYGNRDADADRSPRDRGQDDERSPRTIARPEGAKPLDAKPDADSAQRRTTGRDYTIGRDPVAVRERARTERTTGPAERIVGENIVKPTRPERTQVPQAGPRERTINRNETRTARSTGPSGDGDKTPIRITNPDRANRPITQAPTQVMTLPRELSRQNARANTPAPITQTQPRFTEPPRTVDLTPRGPDRAPSVSQRRASVVESPRVSIPEQRSSSRYEAPRQYQAPAPRQIETPRIQAPAPRIQAPAPQRMEAPRIQAPSPRFEAPRVQAPAPRFEAPRVQEPSRVETRSFGDAGRSGGIDRGGSSRGGDGGGRGRR